MKKIALLVLMLAPIALAGCQTIKAHNPFRHKEPAYTTAQQERPLEMPPGMNQPPATEALTIPDAGGGAAAAAAPSTAVETGAPPAAGAAAESPAGVATSLALGDTPASAYHRVGLALERGEVGKVTAHDDTAMTYQVAVDAVVTHKPEGGFFRRMFSRSKNEIVQGSVTVSVVPQGSGSVVQASGNRDAAARVMAMLQQRLH